MIKDLAGWCGIQLRSDTTVPQCTLEATDGINKKIIPMTPVGNSFSANILALDINRTWVMKIVESKSSQAESKSFQIRRKRQPTTPPDTLGALKIAPISQYTCLNLGLNGTEITKAVGLMYYFTNGEDPGPMPPAFPGSTSSVICHDTQIHPGDDDITYPRLQLVPQAFTMC